MSDPVRFRLDGQEVEAAPGESLLDVALRLGIELPHLCTGKGMRVDGNCRSCVVEIAGERTLAPACRRQPADGMEVRTDSERATRARAGIIELLQSGLDDTAVAEDSEFALCRKGVTGAPLEIPGQPPAAAADRSHPALHFDPAACIQCGRCIRACREVQVNEVIGWHGRGHALRIAFDLDDPLSASRCVACGECIEACPTGALDLARPATPRPGDRLVDSVCPWCGVGCLLSYRVRDDRIVEVRGRNGPANLGRLCVKGRFGTDYHRHPERLTRPLIRRPDAPRRADLVELGDYRQWFEEASWEEALERAAEGFRRIRAQHGGRALAGFGSAKGSNEEAYLFQKLIRTGFGSHNVDHCTRLCHASSVAALLECIGSGAVSNPVSDVAHADLILVIGANPDANHPVAASHIKNAARRGATLIVADPRRTPLMDQATLALQFLPDGDIALINALLKIVLEEDLVDRDFIARRTRGFDELAAALATQPLAGLVARCGIPEPSLREVARRYAGARAAMIFWGMGVSQHTHGTDNVRALISLCLLCGQIGRPGTGLHPLRGQNNVQGASDAGLIPMMLPGYRSVADAEARRHFGKAWQCELPEEPGLTVVEIMAATRRREIRGLYIMGENPALSDPNLNHTRAALTQLEHLVVQEIFLNETAVWADVILPASACGEKTGTYTNTDRRVQLGRKALDPPGEAWPDLKIINALANRLGLDWNYEEPSGVYEEMRALMPSHAGISWARLEREDSVLYPCPAEDQPGTAVLFADRFPTPDGRGRLVPARPLPADELPDAQYPLIFLTGRQLEHWHTGSMSRRSRVLDQLAPEPWCSAHPETLASLSVGDGDRVRLRSRRGALRVRISADPAVAPGQIFMPFSFHEAAANLLTNDALDPDGKIAEVKFCAVRLD